MKIVYKDTKHKADGYGDLAFCSFLISPYPCDLANEWEQVTCQNCLNKLRRQRDDLQRLVARLDKHHEEQARTKS